MINSETYINLSFSQDDVNKFCELSVDTNPIHTDEEYAKNTIFKRPIVPGMLSSSLIGGCITQLFGDGAIYLHQELNFRKPVYIGQKVRAGIKVISKHKTKDVWYLDTTVVDYKSKKVLIKGKAIIKN